MTTHTTRQSGPATTPLESIVWFASSNFFRQGLGAVTTLLRPMLLAPELFGLFTALRLVPMYSQYLHFGARDSMRYMLPLHEAHGEHDRAARLQATVFSGAFAINMVAVLGLLALALFTDWRVEVRIGLVICAATVFVNSIVDHFITELKGYQLFKIVGLCNYFNALTMLVSNLVLILWLGFYGALLAQTVVMALLLVFLALRGNIRFKGRRGFEWKVFWGALSLGAPTMFFDVALLMMRSADRLVIAQYLSYEQLGYYGLGAMMMGYVMNIPGATREVMEAKLFENLRGNSAAAAFHEFVVRPMMMIALTMTVLIGPAVLMLPALVVWILPDYVEGVPATQILVLGAYFLAVSFPIRGIMAAYGWQKWGALILVSAVALHIGFSIVLIKAGLGIVGVALSAGLAFLLAAAALFLFVVFKLPERPKGLFGDAAAILLPFPLMLGVLYAEIRLGAWLNWPTIPTLAVQLAVYGAAVAVGLAFASWVGVIPRPRALWRRSARRTPGSS